MPRKLDLRLWKERFSISSLLSALSCLPWSSSLSSFGKLSCQRLSSFGKLVYNASLTSIGLLIFARSTHLGSTCPPWLWIASQSPLLSSPKVFPSLSQLPWLSLPIPCAKTKFSASPWRRSRPWALLVWFALTRQAPWPKFVSFTQLNWCFWHIS